MLRIILFPLAVLYDAVTSFRNTLYDLGYKPSASFELPLISIGNLAVGGTGKTPMVEYLIRLFYPQYKVATLSRGYGRKTKGFRIATTQDNASTIGDEPWQIFRKFGQRIKVAVGEERALAISQIIQEHPETDLVVLDDAFQHRKVKPSFHIMLTDFSSPFYNDYLLPAGRLRESRHGAARADVIVVTKCPEDLSNDEMMVIEKSVRDYTSKPVFFSGISYGNPVSISKQTEFKNAVILVTGIANSTRLVSYATRQYQIIKHYKFKDHYDYRPSDFAEIIALARKENAMILTTEKDAAKLDNPAFDTLFSEVSCFYLPIETCFLRNGKDFDEMLLNVITTRLT